MIQINNLKKNYGEQTILSDTSFNFPDSGLVCLLGASGCGKSTLLNMLAGFDSDYSGEITVCGTSISHMDSQNLCEYRRENIGFIFQSYNLLSGYTVLENILLACKLNSHDDANNGDNANLLLKKLGMTVKSGEKVENLSGGQKQRVAIARALINNPSIVLADEPTGALDRKNSTEIMELLKGISKERLVLVITHDQKLCEFADSIVSISDGKIIGEKIDTATSSKQKLKANIPIKVSAFKRGLKNFKVHLNRYIAVSLAISIGILAFMLSLSFGNIMERSISNFKEKNTAFNNGYIKADEKADELLKLLKSDIRIENVYNQYCINNVTLRIDGKEEKMAQKYPMPKATENMSYGIMPKAGENQISLSPSLAKKFDDDIRNLIGKEMIIEFEKIKYTLTVSGVFNAGYDDFFVSSDIENRFYEKSDKKDVYSVSYDVKDFEDIVSVSQMLEGEKIKAETAAKEVEALQNTFENLSRLFLVVSILILSIGLFVSIILLVKLQNSRYKEIGLLSALGFSKKTIRAMIIDENILLSAMASILNAIFIFAIYLVSMIFKLDLIITVSQMLLSILGTGAVVILIGIISSYKLINTEPAVALRK